MCLAFMGCDLQLTKSAPASAALGEAFTYTLTVTNKPFGNDSCDRSNVQVTDTLPGNVQLISAVPSQGSCSGTSTITCALGTVVVDGTATVTVTVRPTALGQTTNSATVTGDNCGPNSEFGDPDLSNNTAAVTTNVVVPVSAMGSMGLLACCLILLLLARVALRLRPSLTKSMD
jgi:uncharacterized repeat protein (TIGR01451 family)